LFRTSQANNLQYNISVCSRVAAVRKMPPAPRIEAQSTESTSLIHVPPHYRLNDEEFGMVNESGDSLRSSVDGDEFDLPRGACSALHRAWSQYVDLLDQHPLAVKSVTATFILGGGDLCGQGVERMLGRSGGYVDWARVARFAAFGFFGAPWSHYYFYYLDHYLPPSPRPCSTRTFLKVGIDQGIQAPLLLAIMISMLSVLKGEGWQGIQHDMTSNYWTALMANWRLWIPFSLLNIACVRPSLRVLFVNCVFFGWTIILSLMLNST
jgi:hypothetical protein